MQNLLMICTGLLAGVLSGIFGIGGGVVIIPILVLLLKFKQSTASGTSLVALLLPVGLLGVIQYTKAGKISSEHIRYGLLIASGLFVGTYFGALIAAQLPEILLRRGFALLLIGVAIRMWLTTSA